MLLKEFQKYVDTKNYIIDEDTDFNLLNKYFQDLKDESKNLISKKVINYWNKKNTKISSIEDLQILAYYLDCNYGYDEFIKDLKKDEELDDLLKEKEKNNTIKEITVAGKYKFTYKIYKKDDIRQENIFKLNYYNIIEKLKYYFPQVNILIDFEKPTYIDKELKKKNTTYKHDVIVNFKKYDKDDKEYNIDNTFEIVLEYFEKKHNRFNDEDKRISTNLFTDEYYVYDVNKDDMNEFITSTIYGMIQTICVTTNDEYELCKILYFDKSYKNNNLLNTIQYFNKIIDIQKNNKFNLKQFFRDIKPYNPDIEEEFKDLDEFKDYIEDTYEINIKYIDIKYNCNADIFSNLIMHLNNSIDTNDIIVNYKNIYLNAMKALNTASKKIIEILQKQRSKRLQLPEFIRNIQKFHKDNLKV